MRNDQRTGGVEGHAKPVMAGSAYPETAGAIPHGKREQPVSSPAPSTINAPPARGQTVERYLPASRGVGWAGHQLRRA